MGRIGDLPSASTSKLLPPLSPPPSSVTPPPPPPTAKPPYSMVLRAERLLEAYNALSQQTIEAVQAGGYANWVDTLVGRRLRPGDASELMTRLQLSIAAVARDMREGKISPAELGRASWPEVDGAAIYDLAMRRLARGEIEFPPSKEPLFSKSIAVSLDPTSAALQLEQDPVWQTMKSAAISVADAVPGKRATTEARAVLATAFALYQGSGTMPPLAGSFLSAVSSGTGVSLLEDVQLAPEGTTAEALEARVAEEELAGYRRLPGTDRFLTYRAKDAAAFSAEVIAKIDRGELNTLGLPTLVSLREMLGSAPSRMSSEASRRYVRETASQIIDLALIAVATRGIGAGPAVTARTGAKFSPQAARLAGFAAESATVSVLFGAARGELTFGQFAHDALLAGLAQRAAVLGKSLAGGTGSVVAAGAAVTGFSAIEQTAYGQAPSFKKLSREFAHNLLVIGAVHGLLGISGNKNREQKEIEISQKLFGAAAERASLALERVEGAMSAGNAQGAARAMRAFNRETRGMELEGRRLARLLGPEGAEVLRELEALRAGPLRAAKLLFDPPSGAELARAPSLPDAINSWLTKHGAPPVEIFPEELSSINPGHFNRFHWKININRDLLASGKTPKIVETMVHEGTHVLQAWDVARLCAAENRAAEFTGRPRLWTAQTLLNSGPGIQEHIVEAAAKARPMDLKSAEAARARIWRDELSGKMVELPNGIKRNYNAVLNWLDEMRAEKNWDAVREYEQELRNFPTERPAYENGELAGREAAP
jgi:hypothetical protein